MTSHFKYNPFSGVLAEDLNAVLVPRFDEDILYSKINTSQAIAIEFSGKQGRGKTTHLLYLHQQLSHCPLVLLNANSSASEVLDTDSKIIFIDSIHHLNLRDRIKVFKQNKTLIYTTHYTRKWECFIAKKEIYSLAFNGIDSETLQKILNKRLVLATPEDSTCVHLFSVKDTALLIKKFKDNYRAIINHLYETYQ